MIKTIKKIDLQGNEVWQEVVVCNRCKKVLDSTDFVYRIQWTGWRPVQIKDGSAYGFKAGTNPERHICEDCQKEVEAFLNGEYVPEKLTSHSYARRNLSTFDERVEASKKAFENETTKALKEYRHSFLCTREAAEAIDMILLGRGVGYTD